MFGSDPSSGKSFFERTDQSSGSQTTSSSTAASLFGSASALNVPSRPAGGWFAGLPQSSSTRPQDSDGDSDQATDTVGENGQNRVEEQSASGSFVSTAAQSAPSRPAAGLFSGLTSGSQAVQDSADVPVSANASGDPSMPFEGSSPVYKETLLSFSPLESKYRLIA